MPSPFLREYLQNRPRKALLELTYNCNQSCPFCYCVWLRDGSLYHDELSIDDWKRVIELIVANGTRDITFTGGEPLLKRGWQELVSHARALDPTLKLSLFTNGSLVTYDTLDFLKSRDARFCMTLPGVKNLSFLTGRSTTFSSAISVLEAASKRGLKTSANVPTSTLNIGSLRSTLIAACLAGANAVSAGPIMPEGRATFNPELLLNEKQFRKAQKTVDKVNALFKERRVGFIAERACSCSTEENHFVFKRSGSCSAGIDFFAVGPGGYFRYCLHSKRDEFFWKELDDVATSSRANE